MRIVDFSPDHTGEAARIAVDNYNEERVYAAALPPIGKIPDLSAYAKNGMGVAAFEGETMVGFLCAVSPFGNAFRSTGVTGIFSPMGAHGALRYKRADIYARLYQAAGEKWARAGAASHAVCLYAHDKEAQTQFFKYGFGMRCVDAIRGMDPISNTVYEEARPGGAIRGIDPIGSTACVDIIRGTDPISITACEAARPGGAIRCMDPSGAAARDGYAFFEPAPENILSILRLNNDLDSGYLNSPFFMYREPAGEAGFLSDYNNAKPIIIAALYNGKAIAYIRAELTGETFIRDAPGYLHCSGIYCAPEHRGTGVSQTLLGKLIQKLGALGYTRLGVDFESVNPSGSRFWLKYFTAYAHSVVRRIDEYAMEVLKN